jgi:hypothetical protein
METGRSFETSERLPSTARYKNPKHEKIFNKLFVVSELFAPPLQKSVG